MKIRALWGFVGNVDELKNQTGQVRAGEEFDVSDEYGHTLKGKGLVAEVDGTTKPKSDKQAAPKETK